MGEKIVKRVAFGLILVFLLMVDILKRRECISNGIEVENPKEVDR